MIEMFLAGIAFGLLMGILFTKIHMESKMEELEKWIDDQDELILFQNEYIEQEAKHGKARNQG
jgi:hypothetical protein